MLGSDHARLALDPVAEQDAFIAGGANRVLDGAEGIERPRDQLEFGRGENWIVRLGRFVAGIGKRARDRFGQFKTIPLHDGTRVRERGGVAHRGARADHRRVVARHVGDRERNDARRLRG